MMNAAPTRRADNSSSHDGVGISSALELQPWLSPPIAGMRSASGKIKRSATLIAVRKRLVVHFCIMIRQLSA